jgi:1,4-alpha-glucan branching enzyme
VASPLATAAGPESVYVRFILVAPNARQVALAGTFNRWDPASAPLVRAGSDGLWTVTVALPVGQHQYAFVVDGRRWVPDPAAPAVDDGFGRKNSVVSVSAAQGRVL